MIIMLFGVTNVVKTACGIKLATELNYDFLI